MLKLHSTAARTAATLSLVAAVTAPAMAADVQSRLQELWRTEIIETPAPAEGCFKAEYPSRSWRQVACVKAPARPFILNRHINPPGSKTVGDGNDYTAVGNGPVTTANGSFPTVKGVKSEVDGQANAYTLQLNSEFFATKACSGATNPSQCQGWAQFVYSSGEEAGFIQYWLIGYGNTCPTTPYNDWNAFDGDCYRNSNGISIPKEPVTALSKLKIKGTADSSENSVVMTVGTTAYKAGGKDNVVFLSQNWTASEFNIFGDGGGSQANFNKGASLTVRLRQTDGTSLAPSCLGDSGTTGETSNLTLHACKSAFNVTPYITFDESN